MLQSMLQAKVQSSFEAQPLRRVAIVLNGQARAVTPRVMRDIRQVLRDESLFVSHSREQWMFIARRIAAGDHDLVLCGGGDGTFSRCVTDLSALSPHRPRVFGVLRLGTGNALATSLGISRPTLRGLVQDLRWYRDPRAQSDLPLLRVQGMMAPFAGVGLDATILQDYVEVKQALRRTPLAALGQGPAGYALAVATRSLVRFLLQDPMEVIIRNEGEPACRVDLQGRRVGPVIGPGGVLYRGPATIAAVSTVPFYGLGLKLFPQVFCARNRFQLRVASVGPADVLHRLPEIFGGEFEHPKVHDFFVSAVSLDISRPTALQIGGDLVPPCTRVRVGLDRVRVVWGQGGAKVPASGQVAPSRSRLVLLPGTSTSRSSKQAW